MILQTDYAQLNNQINYGRSMAALAIMDRIYQAVIDNTDLFSLSLKQGCRRHSALLLIKTIKEQAHCEVVGQLLGTELLHDIINFQ